MLNEFDLDVIQKKKIASGARHRRCGSKSKYCGLPSDHLTQKQWKERNGEVMQYNLKKPMSLVEFKKLPVDIQKQYINRVVGTYHTNKCDIARMLGCNPVTVTRTFSKAGIDVKFGVGKRMSKENSARFEAFLLGEEEKPVPAETSPAEENTVEEPAEEPASREKDAGEERHKQVFDGFTLRFSGELDADAIRNSLVYLVPKGSGEAEVVVDVKFVR